MMREFSVVIEKDEDGYFVASAPALRGCHTGEVFGCADEAHQGSGRALSGSPGTGFAGSLTASHPHQPLRFTLPRTGTSCSPR